MNNNIRNNSSQIEWNIETLSIKYPMFLSTYQYILKKYNKHELTVTETLNEITMSPADFYEKKKIGKGIPCYRQKSVKSRISFPVICVALYLSQDFQLVD